MKMYDNMSQPPETERLTHALARYRVQNPEMSGVPETARLTHALELHKRRVSGMGILESVPKPLLYGGLVLGAYLLYKKFK